MSPSCELIKGTITGYVLIIRSKIDVDHLKDREWLRRPEYSIGKDGILGRMRSELIKACTRMASVTVQCRFMMSIDET